MLKSKAAKTSAWALASLLIFGGGGGYPLTIILQRDKQAVVHLNLEYRRYFKAVNGELEENAWEWKYKKLDKSPTIILDKNRRVVLYDDVNLPSKVFVKTEPYGDCSQRGVLKKKDVKFYYERDDGENIIQKKVPKKFEGIFTKNGLCDYRPPEILEKKVENGRR